jgi:hypothetical protein
LPYKYLTVLNHKTLKADIMNFITVFFPYLLLILLILCFPLMTIFIQVIGGIIRIWIFHKNQYGEMVPAKVYGMTASQWDNTLFLGLLVIAFFFLLWVFDFTSNAWLKTKPSSDCEQKIRQADIALAFGFGLVEKNDDEMPGSANDSLYAWIRNHTHVKYLIAQKGIILAAGKNDDIVLLDMHEHDKDKYVNTFHAVDSALQKLDSLCQCQYAPCQVVVVAHNMQMKRVVWLLRRKIADNNQSEKYVLIVPDIKGMPFPANSSQLHTRNRFIYKITELYYSRPRDYLCSLIH